VTDEIGKFVRTTGAPGRFARMKVEDLDRDGNEASIARLEELATEIVDGGVVSVVLEGPFGTGKTRLAVYLLWQAYGARLGKRDSALDFPRFFRATDLAELRFGRSFSAPEDDEDRRDFDRLALERAPFVVIDDVGRVSGYKGEEVYIETIVEKRFDAGDLSTVLTMNQMPTEGRFSDFLAYFETVPLLGRSHRG
jgi:DNA replication protein DnaC